MLGLAVALAISQAATAAITVGRNAAAPSLRVDAHGNAEVSWTSGGRKATMLVPASGPATASATLTGEDVSSAVRGDHIPFQRVLRWTPSGWYYALQAWRVDPDGPVALRFARWRGVPTEVSLKAEKSGSGGVRLSGHATLDERPLPHTARDRFVYLETLVHGAWQRIDRIALSRSASYARAVPKRLLGDSYRATVLGPNVGATYAPDASSVVDAPGDLDPRRRPH
jgi:hypothetical protein